MPGVESTTMFGVRAFRSNTSLDLCRGHIRLASHASSMAQGRLSFSNPFKRGTASHKPQPPSDATCAANHQGTEPGSVPLANVPQPATSHARNSRQHRASSDLPGLVQHAPSCNGSLDHSQEHQPEAVAAATADLAGASQGPHATSAEAPSTSAPKPPAPQGFMRFFSRQATRRAPGLQPLPEQASEPASSSSKQNGPEGPLPASSSAGTARRKEVRFSPEKPQASHSTIPDRISLRGKERCSDADATSRYACFKLYPKYKCAYPPSVQLVSWSQ